uniref:Uncharacterized protein n=1 Tax=Nymphaea colorata TaxID=210225 RepID=A0A5K0WF31_9MAGN
MSDYSGMLSRTPSSTWGLIHPPF